MGNHELIVYATLAVMVALFIWDRLRHDLVGLLALSVLGVTGVLTADEALSGFSNPVVIILASLFIVGEGLVNTGLAARVAAWPSKRIGGSDARAIAVLMALTATLSALMSSTGAVAMMIPVAMGVARKGRMSASTLLMPVAFAAQLGGMLTLIGTPPNMIASSALEAATGTGFDFFAPTPVGVFALGLGVAFCVVFVRKWLPRRVPIVSLSDSPTLAEMASSFQLPATLRRFRVPIDSPLVGKTLEDAALRADHQVSCVQIEHPERGRALSALPRRRKVVAPARDARIDADDVLLLQGRPSNLDRTVSTLGLHALEGDGQEAFASTDGQMGMVEVVLTPMSRWIGKSLRDVHFRERFGLTVIGIKRRGELVPERLSRAALRFGDSLLVAGSWARIDELREERRHFIVAREPREAADAASHAGHAPMAAIIVLGMLLAMTLGWFPVAIAAVAAALAMVLTGCVRAEGAYRTINWPSVVLIATMLPMATALETSGGVAHVVDWLVRSVNDSGPRVALGALMLGASVLCQVMSNTATAVLMAPIGVQVGQQLGIAPAALLMGIAVGASTAFSTPVAASANTLILGPGGYRFRDFVMVGVPLQLLVLLAGWLIIPAWPGF